MKNFEMLFCRSCKCNWHTNSKRRTAITSGKMFCAYDCICICACGVAVGNGNGNGAVDAGHMQMHSLWAALMITTMTMIIMMRLSMIGHKRMTRCSGKKKV